MQLTDTGYQIESANEVLDSAKSYFRSKNGYHYYDDTTEKYYAWESSKYSPNTIGAKNSTQNDDGYLPCDGSAIYINNPFKYQTTDTSLTLPDRIARVNEFLQNPFDKIQRGDITSYSILSTASNIFSICERYKLPMTIRNQYFIIFAKALKKKVDVKYWAVVDNIINKYM